jgi:O-antigen ligase
VNSQTARIARRTSLQTNLTEADQQARPRLVKLINGVIFWSLLALLTIVAIPYGSAESWWEAFFACAVFTLGALWAIESILGEMWGAGDSWRVLDRALLVPLAALVLYCFFQSLHLWRVNSAAAGAGNQVWYAISADPFETRRFAFKLLALVLFGLLLLSHCSSQRRLRVLVNVVIGIGVLSALYGILRQTTQRGTGFLLPFLQQGQGFGQFINQNHFAFLMEMALGVVLGLIVGGGVRRDRALIYLATLLPVWTGLVMANSRGGLLSMLGQLIFVALLFTILPSKKELDETERKSLARFYHLARSLPVRIVLALCLAAAVVVGVIWVGGDPIVSKMEKLRDEPTVEEQELRQNSGRLEIWRATWQMFKEHPLAGVGFGGYWAIIPQYHNASGDLTPQQVHNDYLELLVSGGIIGTALAAWLALILLFRARERLRSKDAYRRAACFGALVGIFGVAVHSLFDFGLHITINAAIFISLLVIATVDSRVEKAQSYQVPQ